MVVGMAADNVIDGVGIAVAFLLDPRLGLVVTAVVVAHEIPQGIASAELLKHAGWTRKRIVMVLVAAGAAYVVGGSLAGLFTPASYQAALAFVTGTFVYIGCADLLTEAHRKFNVKVIAVVVVGALLMFGLTTLEGLVAVA